MPANLFTHIRRGLYDNVYHGIVREKADVNGRDEDTGNTPLVIAVMEKHQEIVQLLLNHGADVNLPDWTGKSTPLDLAEQSGSGTHRPTAAEPGSQIWNREWIPPGRQEWGPRRRGLDVVGRTGRQ